MSERAVRERERLDGLFFRELVELMPQMVWTKDANGRNAYCNRQLIDYMHVSMDEFLNNSWAVAHPDDVARGQAVWRTAVAAGMPYESELRLRPKDSKTYRWFLVRAVPHRDADGRVDKWFGTTTDIDAQRRAFAALDFLAQSDARLAGVQNVDTVLDRLARASLEGLAEISIFDLEENGQFRRLVVTSPDVPDDVAAIVKHFGAPKPNEAHPISRVIETGETMLLADVDEAFISSAIDDRARKDAWRTVDVRSLACAPMIVTGRVRGAVTLVRTGVNVPFTPPEVTVIEEVARRAAVAIDAIRQSDREARSARNVQIFADMGESVAAVAGLAETLEVALRVIVPARADWAYVSLADEHGTLRLAAVCHPDETKRRLASAHIGEPYRAERTTLEVPLVSGEAVRGTITICIDAEDRPLTNDDIEFFEEFARRMGPVIANAELFERERRVARSFQDAALPASLPHVAGYAFDAIYEAGKAEALVGGDWYDVFSLADGRFVISIGDVAGSGLAAAVMMASVRQAVRGAAHVRPDPSVMLAAADRALDDPAQRFVTAFVGVIDPQTSTLTYYSAGHPPPLLRRPDGTLGELHSGGPPLGLGARSDPPPSHTLILPRGSLLVLYTDGLTESTRNMLAGEDRLRAVLCDAATAAAERPAQRLHDRVLTDGSHDDVAILTLRVD